MATYRAIEATCDTVVELLEDHAPPELHDAALGFSVVTQTQLAAGPGAGVTLFLHRVLLDGTERAPDGRTRPDGRRQVPQLPVQLRFILTAWGTEPSLQQYLTGWMMRVVADHPVLPAGLLNRRYDADAEVFWPDETVELMPAAIADDELYQLWDLIGSGTYQLSVPYQARGIRIESPRLLEEGGPVLERVFDYHVVRGTS